MVPVLCWYIVKCTKTKHTTIALNGQNFFIHPVFYVCGDIAIMNLFVYRYMCLYEQVYKSLDGVGWLGVWVVSLLQNVL